MTGDYRKIFNLEGYKAGLPVSFLRRVSAMVNTSGGSLAVGSSKEDALEIVSSISNYITPNPSEFIDTETENGVTIIHVDVGCDRPYYINEKGLTSRGTYKTDSGVVIPRNLPEIIDLLESEGKSFDEQMSLEQELTFTEAEKAISAIRKVKFEDVLPLFKTENDTWNNLALLLSDQCPYRIKVRNEVSGEYGICSGSVLSQLEGAMALIRKSTSQGLDKDSVKEALVNAVMHRNYRMDGDIDAVCSGSSVRISSPGGAPKGVSADSVHMGLSVPRNPELAEVFMISGYAACCGTGIRKIVESSGRDAEEIIEISDGAFAVTISGTGSDGIELTGHKENFYGRDDEEATYMFVRERGSVSRHDIEEEFGFCQTKAYNILKKLSDEGKIDQYKQGKRSFYSTKYTYDD